MRLNSRQTMMHNGPASGWWGIKTRHLVRCACVYDANSFALDTSKRCLKYYDYYTYVWILICCVLNNNKTMMRVIIHQKPHENAHQRHNIIERLYIKVQELHTIFIITRFVYCDDFHTSLNRPSCKSNSNQLTNVIMRYMCL